MECDDIEVFEPREFVAADDHVTVLGWERTRDRATGRSFECEWVHVFWVDKGLATRFWGLLDTEAAAATRSAMRQT
jgi:ketosteroid isomerase-like protein